MTQKSSIACFALVTTFCFLIPLFGCGGGALSESPAPTTPPPPAATISSVSVSCSLATVPVSQTSQCSATVQGTGAFSSSVTWSVNSVQGGNATVGSVSASGMYTAPAAVPTPFTVTIAATSTADTTKSASASVIVAGTIASVTQTIVAATGGTITLPDGSSVTIAPTLLGSDQPVTLTEFSVPPNYPANGLITGIGPALYLTFSQPLQLSAATRGTVQNQRSGHQSSNTAGLAGISFNVNFSLNFPSVNSTEAAFASFRSSLGQFLYQGVQGTMNAASKVGTAVVSAACLSALNDALNSRNAALATVGLYFADLAARPANSPTQSMLAWDPKSKQFLSVSQPCDSIPQNANTKILVVVHGMLSSVEGSFNDMLSQSTFLAQAGYGAVFGIDYDWWNGIAQSGQYVASQLSQIAVCAKGDPIDIMAHSEGVPVSMSALAEPSLNSTAFQHLIAVAGPILGTPVANVAGNDLGTGREELLTVLGNFPASEMVFPPASVGGLTGLLNAQFMTDLETNGVGSNALTKIQNSWQSSPLSNLPVVLAVGTNPDPTISGFAIPLGECLKSCFEVFANEPFDGIVGLDSSFAAGLHSTLYRLPSFPLFHTGLVGNTAVLVDVGIQLNKLSSNSLPSLTISTTSTSASCAANHFCSGPPGSVFSFAGAGFAADSQMYIYVQDPTGTQDPPIPVVVDQGGLVNWTDPIPCSKNAGVYGIWLYDNRHLWASNSVIEAITRDSCLSPNPVPVINSLSQSSFTVGSGPQTLAINGTGFLATSTATFNGAPHTPTSASSAQLTISLTASDLATAGSFPIVVTNPPPGGGSSNAMNLVITSAGSASGSTGIIVGTVNGQTVDKAYVPVLNTNAVAVVNADAGPSDTPLLTTVMMPAGYIPSATTASQNTGQVVVVSYNSADVQIIDAVHDTLVTTYHSPVTQFVTFSGGSCIICGVLVDPASNQAILDTSQGILLMDLGTGVFSGYIPAAPAENFAFNPNTRTALLPTYNTTAGVGLQSLTLPNNAIAAYSQLVGSAPDSAAVDFQTNIVVVPDEFTGDQHLINLNAAVTTGTSFDAPQTVLPLGFTGVTSCTAEWTMVSIESTSHLLFAGTEFSNCAAVEQLPLAPVTGAPPLPTVFLWGVVPNLPDGTAFYNGADPHGIAVFTSVVSGKPTGFLIDGSGPWVARVDLQAMKSAPILLGGLQGQINLAPYVTFLKIQ